MTNYNLIIIENKVQTEYLNLSSEEFYNHLWDWFYDYDLWDSIEEQDLLSNKEELEDWILDFVIPECILHNYWDDEIDCVAFTNSDEKCNVRLYDGVDNALVKFILNKIEEHYGKSL